MSEHISRNPEWTLDKLKTYLVGRVRFLLMFGGAGLLIGLLVLFISPKRYEASFLIKMPTVNAINELGIFQSHLIKVVPPALDAKKLFLKPEQFSEATLTACGYADTNANRKYLVKSIYVTEADYGSSVRVAVRVPGSKAVQICAERLINDVITFANSEKNNYLHYVMRVNKGMNTTSIVNTDAKLTAPVRISDTPVSPRPIHLIVGCLLIGLLLGVLLDWVRCIFAARNRAQKVR